MKRVMIIAAVIVSCTGRDLTAENSPPIDRRALVTRHSIEWNDVAGEIPLGNGEFAFNADGTGLQTFGGNTMSHWGWHSAPLPTGCAAADVPATGTLDKGRIVGPMRRATGRGALDRWMFQNPHAMNLGRLRLVRADATALETKDIAHLARKYDLWNGLQTSSFEVDGQAVRVQTCVHPVLDLVAVRVESALLRQGRLVVVLDFPYPTVQGGPHWAGNWEHPEKHRSDMTMADGSNRADIHRTADTSSYTVSIAWSEDGAFRKWPASATKKLAVMPEMSQHTFILSGRKSDLLEFVCGFAARRLGQLPGVAQTQQATAEHWQQFWKTGGAIDLSQSKDPRWKELERRIVLSQYQMAAQSAGSWPIGVSGWRKPSSGGNAWD